MLLTDIQKTNLKTYILAQPDLAIFVANGQDNAIKDAMNANASPTVLAWRTDVPPQSSDESATYTAFDSILAGKRDSWSLFLGFSRDFTKNKVRNWVVDVWGPAIVSSVSESVLQNATEKASRAENVLGGTLKTTGTVSALDRNWVGDLNDADIAVILRG